MTTNNDKFETRISNEEWGISREYTTGVPIDGSVDPTGEYPKRDYFFSSSISQSARGAKVNKLWYGGSYYGVNFEVFPQTASMFPFSQVNETPSGHSIEIDDTPGGERILLKHRTGAGVELKPDGSIILSARENRVEVTGGDHKVVVSGTGDLVYEGNLNLTVTGDYNVNVGGNYNVEVGANHKENILGSHKTEVARTSSYTTRGSKSSRTYGNNVDFNYNDYKKITRGNTLNLSEGSILTHTMSYIEFTTDDTFSVSTNDAINLITDEMRFSANSGFVGGKEVVHYGRTYTGPDSDGAKGGGVTYYGSLVGRAFEAWTSKYAIYADESYQSHIASYASIAEWADDAGLAEVSTITNSQDYGSGSTSGGSQIGTDKWPATIPGAAVKDGSQILNNDPTFNYGVGVEGGGEDTGIVWKVNPINQDLSMPGIVWKDNVSDSSTQEILLQRTMSGVKNVRIDAFGGLANKISKIKYRGYFDRDPNTAEIRSRFRSFNLTSRTVNQNSCILELIAQGRLNGDFNAPMPAIVDERIVGNDATRIFGKTLLGNPNENRSKSFLTFAKRLSTRTIIPDPRYNPDNLNEKITSKTKLSKGVTLSSFLGAPGSRTSLDYIPFRDGTAGRISILRNLYLHANLLELINNHPSFTKHKLVVSESVYIPSEEEILTNTVGQINQLKTEGRAVVYQLLNSAGNIDYEKMFELAVYIKDHFFFDDLYLDYDTFDPQGKLSGQLIVIMPEIDETFTAKFAYRLRTYFNGRIYAGTELARILPEHV